MSIILESSSRTIVVLTRHVTAHVTVRPAARVHMACGQNHITASRLYRHHFWGEKSSTLGKHVGS